MAQTDEELKTAGTNEQVPPQDTAGPQEAPQPKTGRQPSAFQQIKQQVSEDDDAPVGTLTLRKILGGDILSAQMVRSQIWLLLLIVLFITISVAFRYQCQQDQLQISKMEQELVDIKYKALSSSSNLTERYRQSYVLKALRANRDSTLQIPKQPPFIIDIE